jgi:hypothetical protein
MVKLPDKDITLTIRNILKIYRKKWIKWIKKWGTLGVI